MAHTIVEISEIFVARASTNLLHLRNLFKRVQNDLAQYRDYKNIEQVNISF